MAKQLSGDKFEVKSKRKVKNFRILTRSEWAQFFFTRNRLNSQQTDRERSQFKSPRGSCTQKAYRSLHAWKDNEKFPA